MALTDTRRWIGLTRSKGKTGSKASDSGLHAQDGMY